LVVGATAKLEALGIVAGAASPVVDVVKLERARARAAATGGVAEGAAAAVACPL
jgi:hypothetical protein